MKRRGKIDHWINRDWGRNKGGEEEREGGKDGGKEEMREREKRRRGGRDKHDRYRSFVR